MFMKKTLGAATIALGTAFTSPAAAEECNNDWVVVTRATDVLFEKDFTTWNKDLIASWGPEKIAKLIDAVNGPLQKDLNREIRSTFDHIENQVQKNREVKWDRFDNESFVIQPFIQQVKDGSMDVGTARNEATAAASQYIASATEMLTKIEPQTVACLIVAPAPTQP